MARGQNDPMDPPWRKVGRGVSARCAVGCTSADAALSGTRRHERGANCFPNGLNQIQATHAYPTASSSQSRRSMPVQHAPSVPAWRRSGVTRPGLFDSCSRARLRPPAPAFSPNCGPPVLRLARARRATRRILPQPCKRRDESELAHAKMQSARRAPAASAARLSAARRLERFLRSGPVMRTRERT